ncbi:MAG: hypothetical protein Q3M30_08900 [Candidatus Electrothrix sp. Rat3]|nr:hypothetical protein [Candidatus Electrothrix rattekaaiensis]
MKKGMVIFGALFFVATFTGAGMASGDGDDERYERGERYENEGREYRGRSGDRD